MADISPSFSRPADSWSTTEFRSVKHAHSWTIKNFSALECRYLEVTVKPAPNDPSLQYRIRIHPQGNKESNKDFTFFQVFSPTSTLDRPRLKAKFSIFNGDNDEVATTVYTGQQQLHGYFEYIRRDTLLNHLQSGDEVTVVVEMSLIFESVTKTFTAPQVEVEPKREEVSKDMEILFRDKKFTDFTIVAGERAIDCHKAVLAARSPVFAAMLEPHTVESKQDFVIIDDLEYEVALEMMLYIYAGRSPRIKEMAGEILPAADRYQLMGLKEMAENALRQNMNIENACSSIVLADMHHCEELKQEAVRYIAQNKTQVIKTESWDLMIKTNPDLVTEIVAAIESSDYESTSSVPTSHDEPAAKRFKSTQ